VDIDLDQLRSALEKSGRDPCNDHVDPVVDDELLIDTLSDGLDAELESMFVHDAFEEEEGENDDDDDEGDRKSPVDKPSKGMCDTVEVEAVVDADKTGAHSSMHILKWIDLLI
jgi:hypothetical protein